MVVVCRLPALPEDVDACDVGLVFRHGRGAKSIEAPHNLDEVGRTNQINLMSDGGVARKSGQRRPYRTRVGRHSSPQDRQIQLRRIKQRTRIWLSSTSELYGAYLSASFWGDTPFGLRAPSSHPPLLVQLLEV